MTIVGARPKVGKSAFLVAAAVGASARDETVLYVSLEMSTALLAKRLDSIGADLSEKAGIYGWVPSRGRGTALGIAAELDAFERRHGEPPGLVIVDYLQLLQGPGTRRYELVTQISVDLATMARERNLSMLVASQLNRAGDERPKLLHLRESGAIEQDAFDILLLDRNVSQNSAELDVHLAASRMGQPGSRTLRLDPRTGKVSESEEAIHWM